LKCGTERRSAFSNNRKRQRIIAVSGVVGSGGVWVQSSCLISIPFCSFCFLLPVTHFLNLITSFIRSTIYLRRYKNSILPDNKKLLSTHSDSSHCRVWNNLNCEYYMNYTLITYVNQLIHKLNLFSIINRHSHREFECLSIFWEVWMRWPIWWHKLSIMSIEILKWNESFFWCPKELRVVEDDFVEPKCIGKW